MLEFSDISPFKLLLFFFSEDFEELRLDSELEDFELLL
jgi:hypothetical protein